MTVKPGIMGGRWFSLWQWGSSITPQSLLRCKTTCEMAYFLIGSKSCFPSIKFSKVKRNQNGAKTKLQYYLSGNVSLIMFHWPTGWGERRMKQTLSLPPSLSPSLFISPSSPDSAASIPSSTPRLGCRGWWTYTFWSIKCWPRAWQNSLWHHEVGGLFYTSSRRSASLCGRKGSLSTSNSSTETLNQVWIIRCSKKIC